jgi:hypothetical protein
MSSGLRKPSGQDRDVQGEEPDSSLIELISAAIAAHDPLDPWLVVSSYDDHYWDDVATRVAPAVAHAQSETEVFHLLADALAGLVTISDTDTYARDRVRQAAAAVWQRQGR